MFLSIALHITMKLCTYLEENFRKDMQLSKWKVIKNKAVLKEQKSSLCPIQWSVTKIKRG